MSLHAMTYFTMKTNKIEITKQILCAPFTHAVLNSKFNPP